ncbi:MAG: glycoside hydrolase family 5 protein [Planctomycetota bacterium]
MSFRIRRGVNLSHYLSQSKKRGVERAEYLHKSDIEQIAGWGMDHVRLPIDEEQMWSEDNLPDAEAWDLMDRVLDWCEQADLRAVVDLHILRDHYFLTGETSPLWTDPAAVEHFGDLWRQLSGRLQSRSEDRVAYELLNEAVAPDEDDWNRVLRVPLAAIREGEPTRTVLIGSNKFNNVVTYDALDVPDDENLICTFHFYYPMLITHYRASWTPCRIYDGPTNYPGVQAPPEAIRALPDCPEKQELMDWNEHFDAEKMAEMLAQPLVKAKETGLPLHCGEFGAVRQTPTDDRLRWYRDLIDLLESHEIAWSHWDYAGTSFGLVDPETRQPRDTLDVLMGR